MLEVLGESSPGRRNASAKVLGQRHIREFETAQSQHDLCGRREGLMGGEKVRGKQRMLHTKAWGSC